MKLATLKDGSRDGMLAVVSRDLTRAHFAAGMASTLQQVLDDWNFRAPQLEDLYTSLNAGKLRHAFTFDPRHCMAPLPRAFRWVQGLAERQDGAPPSMTAGSSDDFLGPCDDVLLARADDGMACDAGVAVITSDVPQGCDDSAALEAVRLFMLVNRWTLQRYWRDEQARSAAALHSQLVTSFSPVAVTADELGAAWRSGGVQLPLQYRRRGQSQSHGLASPDSLNTGWHFGQFVAHLAHTRRLRAGSIIGRFNANVAVEGTAVALAHSGLQWGDRVHIEMIDSSGQSVFGAIDQAVAALPQADLIDDDDGPGAPVRRRTMPPPPAPPVDPS